MPNALARSFVVSVLPVPAGPAGAQPIFKCSAYVAVTYILSVSGVMTSLAPFPKYSYEYQNEASAILQYASFFSSSQ